MAYCCSNRGSMTSRRSGMSTPTHMAAPSAAASVEVVDEGGHLVSFDMTR